MNFPGNYRLVFNYQNFLNVANLMGKLKKNLHLHSFLLSIILTVD